MMNKKLEPQKSSLREGDILVLSIYLILALVLASLIFLLGTYS